MRKPWASRRSAALHYRGLYAVARTRRASRPGTNQEPTRTHRARPSRTPRSNKLVGVPPSKCWSSGAACATTT